MDTFVLTGSSGSLGLLVNGKVITLNKTELDKLEQLFGCCLAFIDEAKVVAKINQDIIEARLFPSTRGTFFDWCTKRIEGFKKLAQDAEMKGIIDGL